MEPIVWERRGKGGVEGLIGLESDQSRGGSEKDGGGTRTKMTNMMKGGRERRGAKKQNLGGVGDCAIIG